MDQRPKYERENFKTLGRKQNKCDFRLGNDFLDMMPKVQTTRGKIDKLDSLKQIF